MCRKAAEQTSAPAIRAALAARGPGSFETNLSALEACIALGAGVTTRHAVGGELRYFLTPSEPPACFAETAAAVAAAIPPWPLAPAAGEVLCGAALQALAQAGAVAAAPYRDDVKVWRGYDGDAFIADCALRLAGVFDAADEELKARMLARGTRVAGGGGDGVREEEKEEEEEEEDEGNEDEMEDDAAGV